MEDRPAPKLRRIERRVADTIQELVDSGALRDLPGEGAPFTREDLGGDDDATWAARRLLRNADAAPEWALLRRDIDGRIAAIRRRVAAHREWLHDRARLLAELPAERIVDASRATALRDVRVREDLDRAVGEVNALIRRYDLLVVPAMQLALVTLERLAE